MKEFKTYLQDKFGFSASKLELLLACFEERQLQKKDFFLKQGSVCKTIAFVEKGCFVFFYNIDGEEKVCDFALETNWLAQYKSLLSAQPSELSIQATEDSLILSMNLEKMNALCIEDPSFNIIRTTLAEEYFTKSTQRSSNLTNLDAKARYQNLLEEVPVIHDRLAQYYIASYLGIKPQSLSRIRAEK